MGLDGDSSISSLETQPGPPGGTTESKTEETARTQEISGRTGFASEAERT